MVETKKSERWGERTARVVERTKLGHGAGGRGGEKGCGRREETRVVAGPRRLDLFLALELIYPQAKEITANQCQL